MQTYALRLKNGDDLKDSLDNLIKSNNYHTACVLTCVGRLQKVVLRFASQAEAKIVTGKCKIVSLVGTLSINCSHLHIAIADENGMVTSGHLKEGSHAYTTAEIVLGILKM